MVQKIMTAALLTIALGKTMLFASQCVLLINHELDQR